ncbi:unnamed protein product [Linum tenue]|uniref:Uncharacterized protein n=1 Tax=Linum tenue TaxID=586396 RepID=A0AAV0Q6S6_9ROSI|nr:unnamed protein product [Linum tenue]
MGRGHLRQRRKSHLARPRQSSPPGHNFPIHRQSHFSPATPAPPQQLHW